MIRLYLTVIVVFLIGTTGAVAAGPNGECTCRHKGGDVPEGKTICMQTPKGMQMAKCDRVLNNTSWKFLGLPCPSAANSIPASVDNS